MEEDLFIATNLFIFLSLVITIKTAIGLHPSQRYSSLSKLEELAAAQ